MYDAYTREGEGCVWGGLCMHKPKILIIKYFIIWPSKWFRNVLFLSPLLIL